MKILNILSHTPIKSIGFNFYKHQELKFNVQEKLQSYFVGSELDKKLNNMTNIVGTIKNISGITKFDWEDAILTINIENSLRLDNAIYVNYNFHRALNADSVVGTEDALKFLRNYKDGYEKMQEIQNIISAE